MTIACTKDNMPVSSFTVTIGSIEGIKGSLAKRDDHQAPFIFLEGARLVGEFGGETWGRFLEFTLAVPLYRRSS